MKKILLRAARMTECHPTVMLWLDIAWWSLIVLLIVVGR